ncbi:hypothetical protein PM082_011475 [Marasmius tenuissimus]|nr:hypothetical protein PM082_011475 [Marasmius tenuissimus]
MSYLHEYGLSWSSHPNLEPATINLESPAFQNVCSGSYVPASGWNQHQPFDEYANSAAFESRYNAWSSITTTGGPLNGNALRDGLHNLQTTDRERDILRDNVMTSQPRREMTLGANSGISKAETSSRCCGRPVGQVDTPRRVGSIANTEVALKNRRNRPRYFCHVPRCTSRGFTQKHNFECE